MNIKNNKKGESAPKLAVIYTRCATDPQSIIDQLNSCREFAVKHGYIIVVIFIDKCMSGNTADRPQFRQILADSRKKLFDTVIVHDFTRFFRDWVGNARYTRLLNNNGVNVVSVTETKCGSASVAIESVFDVLAELQSKELSKKNQAKNHKKERGTE